MGTSFYHLSCLFSFVDFHCLSLHPTSHHWQSSEGNLLISPWRVQWGCTDFLVMTLTRWPPCLNGAPVIVTANLSVHPPACSSVSFVLPFGNHSTWFGQLPHVHSSPLSCLNSSSSHLSSDGLKGMLQPPSDPRLCYYTPGVLLTAHKEAVPWSCACMCKSG